MNQLVSEATQFEVRMKIPNPKAVGLGEMKSLYLACCVIAGEILSGDTAERVRADLVAVRDNRAELAVRNVVDVASEPPHPAVRSGGDQAGIATNPSGSRGSRRTPDACRWVAQLHLRIALYRLATALGPAP